MSVTFFIYSPGEYAAGMREFYETVTVNVEHEVVGEAEFVEHMRAALKDWYEGASVSVVTPA